MINRIVATAALVGTGLVWASAGLADGALAVGMPGGNPLNGFRHSKFVNELDAATASSKAMADCHAAHAPKTGAACRLIGTFRDQCAAVAVNGDAANDFNVALIAAGWAIAPSSDEAARGARAQCDKMRKGRARACEVEGKVLCDGNAK
jgi:hypothetical protein